VNTNKENESDSRIKKRNTNLMKYMMSQFDVIFHELVAEMKQEGQDPVELASFESESALRDAFMADFVAYYTADHIDQMSELSAHTVELHEMKDRMMTLLQAIVKSRGDIGVALRQAGLTDGDEAA